MYVAELHGKLSQQQENQEDILTSNVFSFFKYADRCIFLQALIRTLGINVSEEDARQAEFVFWPHYEDHTEPDLVLLIGKYYLLFEAKYHSGFGQETKEKKHQVVRELQGGQFEARNLGKEFRIIAITAHYTDNVDFRKEIPSEYLASLLWINWQSIAWLLYEQVEKYPHLPLEMRLFATDLYTYLANKKLRNFAGTKAFSRELPNLYSQDGNLFYDFKSARYRGDFVGFIPAFPDAQLVRTQSDEIIFFSRKK
jgi:hypothetical protein